MPMLLTNSHMRKSLLILSLLFTWFWGGAQSGYVQEGKASFYADKFEGRTTASGERYSHNKSTCAHLSLPFGTLVKVTNLSNDKSIVVRVNDRGPFVPNRIIDLSLSAAQKLDFVKEGITDVKVEVVDDQGAVVADRVQEPARPTSVKEVERPASTVAARPESRPTTGSKPVTSQPKVVTASDTEISELYSVNVTRLNPQGYAVQIGSYKELVNLLRIADDLKTSLKEEVRVQVSTLNGEKIYRLMVGGFPQRSGADALKRRVEQLYPDCFVVELK